MLPRRRITQTLGSTFKTLLHRRQAHNSAVIKPPNGGRGKAGGVISSSSAKSTTPPRPSGSSIFTIGEKCIVYSGLCLGCGFTAGYNVAKFNKGLKNINQLPIVQTSTSPTLPRLPESLPEFKDLLLTDDDGKVIQVRPLRPGRMITVFQKLFVDNKESKCTNILIASNVLVHIANVVSGRKLADWGAQVNHLIAQGQWWRIGTSKFLHGGLIHLGLNMDSLYQCGQTIEAIGGPKKFLTVYCTSALTGAWMTYHFLKGKRGSLGASGALFGLLGAEIVYVIRNKELDRESKDTQLKNLGEILLINLVFGIVLRKFINNWAHLGGFLGGAATGLLLDVMD